MSQPDTISSGGTTAGNAVEQHSIDYIPAEERHGNVWRQGPFWFVTNFNFFSIALGFVGPSLGLSVLWTVVAGVLGLVFGGLFMAFHGSQGPKLGLPQMIQARAQFGYRGVIVPTLAVVITLRRRRKKRAVASVDKPAAPTTTSGHAASATWPVATNASTSTSRSAGSCAPGAAA